MNHLHPHGSQAQGLWSQWLVWTFFGAGAAEVPVAMILFEFVDVCLMAMDDCEVRTEHWPEAGEVAEAALITFL